MMNRRQGGRRRAGSMPRSNDAKRSGHQDDGSR
jgi:hypothetical protein